MNFIALIGGHVLLRGPKNHKMLRTYLMEVFCAHAVTVEFTGKLFSKRTRLVLHCQLTISLVRSDCDTLCETLCLKSRTKHQHKQGMDLVVPAALIEAREKGSLILLR